MRKKIVIVDDENDIREILRNAVELMTDWLVFEAPNGLSGLQLISAEKPDVVLLDVMMPAMDGREVIRQLRDNAETENIPVIFLTASLQKSDVRELEELGPLAVLAKPFDPLELIRKISELLHW